MTVEIVSYFTTYGGLDYEADGNKNNPKLLGRF